jgi:hypothetical protein
MRIGFDDVARRYLYHSGGNLSFLLSQAAASGRKSARFRRGKSARRAD